MKDAVEVAIVGAGPYGLSVAAHLSAAGVRSRHFGLPMQLWQTAMPRGMFLKSQGFASNLSDPKGRCTLEAFCVDNGLDYADYGLPVPLQVFVDYGRWFQAELCPGLEEVLVTGIGRRDGLFELALANADRVLARNVVIAVGVEHFAYMPAPLASLSSSVCTHSSEHADLSSVGGSAVRGREVAVVGAGQSALESAALLHESGASVTVVAREPALVWNGQPLAPSRPLLERLREPEAGLGSGWSTWFYSNHPGLFRRLPPATRERKARTALGPAGASWLRPRVAGRFPVLTGQAIRSARHADGGVRLSLGTAGGPVAELTAEHVIAATGYRPDLTRLRFLSGDLAASVKTRAGSPAVGRHFESSVPGLYFVGPAVAAAHGPVMRFVYGAQYAATLVTDRLAAGSRPTTTSGVRG